MLYLLRDFLIGGILVSLFTYVVRNFDVKSASIIWSYPIRLMAAFAIIWTTHYDIEQMDRLGFNALRAMIIKLIFIWLFTIFFTYSRSFFTAFIVVSILWIILSTIWYKLL